MGSRLGRKPEEVTRRVSRVSLRADRARREEQSAELLSRLAHDVRNPLSVILVSARLIARALGPDHEMNCHVAAIDRAADEINEALQDATDAAQLDRYTFSLAPRAPFPVAPLVERAIAATAVVAALKGILVELSADADLPTPDVDRERIARVVQHLLLGALQHAPQGGRVALRLDACAGGVRLAVSDDGPGIPQEVVERHLFSRDGGGLRPLPQGTGVGAFVARAIIEAHGGAIWAERVAPRGSRFVFTLKAQG